MFHSMFFMSILLIFFSCQTADERLEFTSILGSRSEGITRERLVVGRCVVFGEVAVYLDCLLVLPNGDRYMSISEVSVLMNGSNAMASIFRDRRVSGESLYSAQFHYRPGSQSRTIGTARGLPGILDGDIYRGDPSKGGAALMKDIIIRIEREFYWGKIAQDYGSGHYFAFQENSRIWAVPLTKQLDRGGEILSIRVLDRMKKEDLSTLGSGALISIEQPEARGKTTFRFLHRDAAYETGNPRRLSYRAEIIEE